MTEDKKKHIYDVYRATATQAGEDGWRAEANAKAFVEAFELCESYKYQEALRQYVQNARAEKDASWFAFKWVMLPIAGLIICLAIWAKLYS